jgi:hypothetical protein
MIYLVVDKVTGYQGYGHIERLDGKTLSCEERNIAQVPFLANYVNHGIQPIFEVFWLRPIQKVCGTQIILNTFNLTSKYNQNPLSIK